MILRLWLGLKVTWRELHLRLWRWLRITVVSRACRNVYDKHHHRVDWKKITRLGCISVTMGLATDSGRCSSEAEKAASRCYYLSVIVHMMSPDP
jgi:hypothetical protein